MMEQNEIEQGKAKGKFKWWILLFLLPIGLLGYWGVSYLISGRISYTGAKIDNCKREFAPRFSSGPYYEGDLYDAHFHLPPAYPSSEFGTEMPVLGKDVTINEIVCSFDKEKVKGAIAFYMPKKRVLVTLPGAAEIKRATGERFDLFIMPGFLSKGKLEKILTANKGMFSGLGELAYYLTERMKPLDSQWSREMFQVAGRRNLVVMFHPGRNQLKQIKKVFQENPNTKFLLHGYEVEYEIEGLMEKYPNVYFSVDSAVLYAMQGKFVEGPKDEFLTALKEDFNSILNERVIVWKDQIAKYPDRFMWGTDRFLAWHFEDDTSALFEEFARAFIGRLDPAVQEKFAYKNALTLLGK